MAVEYLALAISSFLIGEILSKLKIKALLVFQSLKNTRANLTKLATKVSKKGSSYLVFGVGKRVFNMHHSKFGWMLAGVALIFSNLALLSFSFGFIIHHLVREKSIF